MVNQYDSSLINNHNGETIHFKDNSSHGSLYKEEKSTSSAGSDYSNEKWYVKFWRRDKLMIFIIIGVALGFLVGLLINSPVQELKEPTKSTVLTIIGFPGEILMRLLKMLILPLIVSSLIIGLAELDQRACGRLGRRAILYYMSTTMFAVILGILLVVSINPGSSARDNKPTEEQKKEVRAIDSFLDLIRNMFPENLVQACIEQLTTGVKKIEVDKQRHNVTGDFNATQEALRNNRTLKHAVKDGINYTYYETFRLVKVAGKSAYGGSTNVLGLVAFSLVVGVILGKMGKKGRIFVTWMTTLNDIVMEMVTLVMWYSPIGIWSLIAEKFASMENIDGTFESLAKYMLTVIGGLIIHSVLILPVIYVIFTRKNPLTYVKGLVQALLTAFGTSSSSATLPVTFRCLEEVNKIDKRVTRFVLPIGATINMDGTALYEAVAAIFIAQAEGLDLNFGQYIAVSLTATLASIGAAGIPQAGLVTMLIVLQTIGLPEEAAALIIAVDWFLDRIRTTVNVLGDAIGAGIVHHLSREDLREMDLHQFEMQSAKDADEPLVEPPKYEGLTAM